MKKFITVINSILLLAVSFANTSLFFDNENDYVVFQDQEQYALGDFTMEAWVDVYDYTNKESIIFCNYNREGQGIKWGLNQNGIPFLEINGERLEDEVSGNLKEKGCAYLAVKRAGNRIIF